MICKEIITSHDFKKENHTTILKKKNEKIIMCHYHDGGYRILLAFLAFSSQNFSIFSWSTE